MQRKTVWQALERCKLTGSSPSDQADEVCTVLESGKTRAIGVSNLYVASFAIECQLTLFVAGKTIWQIFSRTAKSSRLVTKLK